MSETNTEIALADKYYESVVEGLKKQTIRKGRRDYPLGRAKFVFENNEDQEISIHEIAYKPLGSVTEEEAMADGFKGVGELDNALRSFYPDISLSTEVTLVKFTIITKV